MRARRTGARAAEARTAAVVADKRALLVLDRERRLQRLGARLGALGRRAASRSTPSAHADEISSRHAASAAGGSDFKAARCTERLAVALCDQ